MWENNILIQDEKIKAIYENAEYQDDFFNSLLQIEYAMFRRLYMTVQKNSLYSTDHGTKGSEYENVVCFIDDNDWKTNYNFNNYFDESDIDKPRYNKTGNMFYVVCSRAIYNLGIVFLSELTEEAKCKLKEIFGESNFYYF